MKATMLCAMSALLLAAQAMAADKVEVCAKYRQGYNWSNPYKVEATSLTGSELNLATRRVDFDYIARYVVIFWDQGQASIIKLDYPFLTYVAQNGIDQRGVQWEVSLGSVCY
ncbi:hypothetical protein [Chromobacterium violaceum]|uniref:hypothetical protein n=1 Tax=Chromobacterium violaceum TaxID=536 RepID=UPI0005BC08E4|nr:hypothetical protein [Chromobacterium violaceum]